MAGDQSRPTASRTFPMQSFVNRFLDPTDILYQQVLKRLEGVTPDRTRLKRADLYGAIATFWLVFLSAVPAVLPFLVFHQRFVALRVSNLLLLIMLFLAGYRWARATHCNPWTFDTTLPLAGLVLVAIAVALGG